MNVGLSTNRRPCAILNNRLRAVARPSWVKPTWLSQGTNAFSSLVLVALLTRSLHIDDFAIYATVLATYTFGNALVGTTVGTRAIEELSAGGRHTIAFNMRRDAPPIVACLFAAAAITFVVRVDFEVALAAAVGMLGILLAELGGAHPLGLRRYWTYAALTAAQSILWVGSVGVAATVLPASVRLPACLCGVLIGAIPYVVYLLWVKGICFSRDGAPKGARSPISSVGVANLALWILASGDRVILAHYALAALATYAAIYGLLDRVFRTIANAEIQLKLPRAFIDKDVKRRPFRRWRYELLLLALGTVCSLLSPTAIAIVSGGHYHPSLMTSSILSFAMMAMLAAVPCYVSLIAKGHTLFVAFVAGVAAALNIGGNLIFAPLYGTTSAAILTLIGYLVWLGGVRFADRFGRFVLDLHTDVPLTIEQ